MPIARSITAAAAGLVLISTLAACGGGVEGSAQAAANSIQAAISANQAHRRRVTGNGSPSWRQTAQRPPASPTPPPKRRRRHSPGRSERPAGTTVSRSPLTTSSPRRASGTGSIVTINLTYQNLGTEEGHPADADIMVDGLAQEGFFDTPGVPAGGTAKGTAILTVSPRRPAKH